ncbi:hypothetical protein [Algivirga pacifica]|uniref:DUF1640 domain-containing protein n=1 Tax=Algivirga pacifica TaxID=1162670 RepID=A0ABP9DHL1_9BACT
MKTIEQFSLLNIILIDKYLNDRLNPRERKEFLDRLGMDDELMDDFDTVVDAILKDKDSKKSQQTIWHKVKAAREKSLSMSRGGMLKDVVGYGLFAIGIAGALVLVLNVVTTLIA